MTLQQLGLGTLLNIEHGRTRKESLLSLTWGSGFQSLSMLEGRERDLYLRSHHEHECPHVSMTISKYLFVKFLGLKLEFHEQHMETADSLENMTYCYVLCFKFPNQQYLTNVQWTVILDPYGD